MFNNNNNNNNCQIIDVAIPDDGRVRAKEDELGSRKISRSRERNSKDVGHKDKGDTHNGGGIGNNTTKVKRKSEDYRCRHIH